MKKKKLLLPVLVFASIFANVQTTQAMTIGEDGKRWWTIEELLQTTKEMDEIVGKTCENKPECIMDETFKMIDSDGKYRAADILNNMILMITDINPTNNTIKIVFNEEDGMMKRMGRSEKYDLDELIIVWREEEDASNSFVNPIRLGEKAVGWREVFTYLGGETDIKPGEEIELKGLPSSNLIDNKKGVLEYSILAGPLGAGGDFNYTSCINSPDYKEGMSCKMMISESPDIAFVPFNPDPEPTFVASEETTFEPLPLEEAMSEPESALISEEEATNKLKPMPAPEESASTEPGTDKLLAEKEPETKLLADDDNILPTNNYIDETNTGKIKAPDTGKYSSNTQKSSWQPLFLTVFIGILLGIVWILRKNLKKSKKI